MTDIGGEIARLSELIARCQPAMTALGDRTRQHIILSMMAAAPCERGLRVGEIAARANLSRPTVSHHLKILKDCGIVRMRRDGTRNYYALDGDPAALDEIIVALTCARTLIARPDLHCPYDRDSADGHDITDKHHHEGAEQ
ncbi:ArsR/SmtB family transcription factor [Bifidobacterium samirii]|uniref:Transcriptional regulator n=1 Tax=Bifidobacterium samirii TaxID=2306974 RepID=A0A430FUP2_9BIFI|nr:winged helix-turn-helix domain-containing protein [Bifidobacterium samirii]RSX56945.1 transcriptional regulator [Bifidobacterium samirii]